MKAFLMLSIVGLFLLSACAQDTMVGNDADEHGCIASAGYTWCEAKQECIRPWEQNCTTEPAPVQALGCAAMTEEEALNIARNSACGDNFKCECPQGYRQEGDACNPECYYSTPQCDAPSIVCGPILTCNPNSNTYWIDLTLDRKGCNPACVVDTNTKSAEINWRCTGLLPQ